MLTQITEQDVERSSTLEPEDVGKWCLTINEFGNPNPIRKL